MKTPIFNISILISSLFLNQILNIALASPKASCGHELFDFRSAKESNPSLHNCSKEANQSEGAIGPCLIYEIVHARSQQAIESVERA